ncbi:antirestriction protein ArdR [Pseudomonas aeruginosa]|uniref:antirestriction protein ArdR n=1 Tax=Pseudomonas aeruginosa TaxID=287 RepID=UPI003D29AC40
MSQIDSLRTTAAEWRLANPEKRGGVVLIWHGAVYGWKNCLRDPSHEQPGAHAVDEAGHVFIAEGGNEFEGAKDWVAVASPKSSR